MNYVIDSVGDHEEDDDVLLVTNMIKIASICDHMKYNVRLIFRFVMDNAMVWSW